MTLSLQLTPEQLERLITEFTDERVEAIALTGSFARGAATRFSDVDLLRFMTVAPTDSHDRYALYQRDGLLVSVSGATIVKKRAELSAPDTAIWAVPGLRQARILLDKEGALAQLKADADAFTWSPLQAAADRYAGVQLMGYAEEVHKVLGALERNDESALIYATLGLVLGMSNMLAVQRGLLLASENDLFREVQRAAGADSAWTCLLRQSAGFDPLTSSAPPGVERGWAALKLYRESVRLLEQTIGEPDMPVVQQAMHHIEQRLAAVAKPKSE